MHGDDRIDQLIESGLRSYAEPTAIPETRVAVGQLMARVAEQEPPRLRWWLWAAPVAACLLALLAVWMLRTPQHPRIAWTPASPPVVGVQSVPGSTSAPVLVHPRRVSRAIPRAPKEQLLPKLAVFPTPTPLSPEEQALVAFAKHGPPAVQHAVLEDQKHWDDPIIVAELQEKSLQAINQQNQ